MTLKRQLQNPLVNNRVQTSAKQKINILTWLFTDHSYHNKHSVRTLTLYRVSIYPTQTDYLPVEKETSVSFAVMLDSRKLFVNMND